MVKGQQQSDLGRVAVAMSGGVDSSVSAALLKEQGYDVVGIFMRNWSEPVGGLGACPWVQDQRDVRRVCAKLGIPCYTFSFEKEYAARVVEYFFKEYKAGRTPNPDVMCNKEIKFDLFRQAAKSLGAQMMATGHYACLVKDKKGIIHLHQGLDANKDQSYFLWMLGQAELRETLFPIGHLQKSEVRQLAKKFNLSNAEKKDSQGICFIGPIEVREFLQTRINPKAGPVLTTRGEKIGQHEGVWFYTIGQRLGLESVKWPTKNIPALYVVDKDIKANTLIAGRDEELYAQGLICDNIHWVSSEPRLPIKVKVAIRYRQKPVAAVVEKDSAGLKVKFSQPQRAITPGQSVVFYTGDELIGGGVIK